MKKAHRREAALTGDVPTGQPMDPPHLLTLVWSTFVVAALLLLDVLGGAAFAAAISVLGLATALGSFAVPSLRRALPWFSHHTDGLDMAAIAIVYALVVGLFRLAFTVFTVGNVLGLFLSFGAALVIGTAAPILYTVWIRGRTMSDLGIGLHHWRKTAALALIFGGVQFAITLWNSSLPRLVDWVPLLVMSLTVGVFESIFFRGFVQGRLEASFGTAPSVVGAAALYAVYHVGYGMRADEMTFLFGLGIVYAVAYRLTENLFVLWPLLTPLGSFFAQLNSGELAGQLPWASIAGFADVLVVMALVVFLAHRRQTRVQSRPRLSESRGRSPGG